MRNVVIAIISAWLLGCASTPNAPREYLDEQTAATITVVDQPWIFTRELTAADQQRDFLHLYAIDVNRMGTHRQYFAALQSAPKQAGAAPVLELSTGEQTVQLQAVAGDSRELGIAQPVAESYTLDAAWWYYPVDKQALASWAKAADLQARLIGEDGRIAYVLWRDGRDGLSELTALLP